MNFSSIIRKLTSMANKKNVEGMARFGIKKKGTLGISVVELRKLANEIKKHPDYKNNPEQLHKLALKLWNSKVHEARMLAGFIDIPSMVAEEQMDKWISDFDSWDICDQLCTHLFRKTPIAYSRVGEWSRQEEEFMRRAGFAMMAVRAVHDKTAIDQEFEKYFPLIIRYSTDERNFVKKAVNWALRQIGKRNPALRKKAIAVAEEILVKHSSSSSARWIARDALRELKKRTF